MSTSTASEELKAIAKESKAKSEKGQENVRISLTDTYKVEIIKDGKYLKKGTVLKGVSALAKDAYIKKGIAKEVK
ncbi:hypothetical protein [Empedobacter brevis]|uniref:hypothetical protein n=1 Tax=Empedobacter brevis TaxID=247 RepID=UPI0028D51671|nr:hypothetical protein [Empedobacter brevis]